MFIAHEMGHVLGLGHSFDTNSAPWDPRNDTAPGAYGDSLDIMSAGTFAGLPATFDSKFGPAGPGLNAVTRESLGWLPENRIWKTAHNPGEDWSVQTEVAALDNPVSALNLMLKITATGIYNGSAPDARLIKLLIRARQFNATLLERVKQLTEADGGIGGAG
jgi:M6 family metalloprotease-like protein